MSRAAFVRNLLTLFAFAAPGLALACTPFVEEYPASSSASFRPHTSAFEHCETSEQDYRQVVADWLRARPADAAPLTPLSLGRAVTFPWLSRHIADAALQSPDWAGRIARVKPGQRDRLAAPILHDPALLQRLSVPFEGSQYVVQGLSFEKVLYGRVGEHSSRHDSGAVKVPFDAQLWLRLAPRP